MQKGEKTYEEGREENPEEEGQDGIQRGNGMKKKIKDLTFAEIARICEKYNNGNEKKCPLYNNGICIPYLEVEIPEEETE